MGTFTAAFSGFSVDDLAKAKHFYGKTLGLDLQETMEGITIMLPQGAQAFAYQKEGHEPATYTMLNLVVSDITAATNELTAKGVAFEQYDGMHQDVNGIAWGKKHGMGPNIAWFKDPAGNILAVLES